MCFNDLLLCIDRDIVFNIYISYCNVHVPLHRTLVSPQHGGTVVFRRGCAGSCRAVAEMVT